YCGGVAGRCPTIPPPRCTSRPTVSGSVYNPTITPELIEHSHAPLDDPWLTAPERPVPVVLGVGRLVPNKDFANLIQAVALVRQQRPLRLLILGEGDERPRLEALVQRLGLSDAVRMPGYVTNPYAYMRRADLFVLSSANEGLPGVLIEAMACGAPVVATDCATGPREILTGGQYGRLVPVGDSTALAAAIVATLDHPQPAEQLQERAALFSAERAVGAYLELAQQAGITRGH
ncbi:MAG: glycosyltransferase, partial [Chloroflexaceae bacterium]|nr:glycosyltransferase [Chloroflexaceae bacterium]